MNWYRSVGVWVLVWLAVEVGYVHASNSVEKPDQMETVVIPLDQIWASQMPGTRKVEELDESLVSEIRRAIGHSTPDGRETKSASTKSGGTVCLRHAEWQNWMEILLERLAVHLLQGDEKIDRREMDLRFSAQG